MKEREIDNMKMMKIVLAAVLLLALCLTLCACGISKKEAVGTWAGSYVYNGNQFARSFVLSEDGTYVEVVLKNGDFSSTEEGTYEVKGGKVILHENGNTGISTVYKYKGGNLVNNDHEFAKVK